MKLLSPKVLVTKRENVRRGKYVQVVNEKKKWNFCGKMMMVAIGETVLSSRLDKGECHERGVS